jgi:hypothetical protein
VVMSNGGFGGMPQRILAQLAPRRAAHAANRADAAGDRT